MLLTRYKFSAWVHGLIACLIAIINIENVETTEITNSTWVLDTSLGFEVNLPTLTCRAKYTEYKEVKWYKDYVLLKQGGVSLSDHILALVDLLENSSSVYFENPLQLQGYYWCETDYINASSVHRFLFRITEVKTFVGKLLATQDSLGDDEELSMKEKISIKKSIYEYEMQQVLFGFLPEPNTFVTDIIVRRRKGLEVWFYIYVRKLFEPRVPYKSDIIEDEDELHYLNDYLNNETTTVDQDHYQQLLDWTKFRGINIRSIEIRSTVGCYQDVTLVPAEPPIEITWPYANIGEIVIPDEACSSKNGLAVTRYCAGSFYNGARWGNPTGKCNMPPSKLTLQLKNLYNKFGDDPKPIYIKKLQDLTNNPLQLTVTDMHIVTDILTELSEVPELTSDEIDEAFTMIDRMAETNVSELVSAKGTIKLTSRLLTVIDNVFRLASARNKEVKVAKKHLLVETKYTKMNAPSNDHIIGIAVINSGNKNTLEDKKTEFLLSSSSIPKHESLAYFLLPPELVIKREKETAEKYDCQINVVLFENWYLFPKPIEILYKRNYKIVPTPVMYVSLSGGSAWNLTSPVHLYFKNEHDRKIENPICVHYDPRVDYDDGGWGTEGCEYGGIKDGFHICRCSHLSIFAVILKDFLIGDSIYKESVVKFRVAVTIFFFFVMSWLFGFFALNEKSKELRILFSISITLTAYYITLFFVFHEFSFWEMCRKWKKNKEPVSEVVKYTPEKRNEEQNTEQKTVG
ncbi:GPS domain-containing protein [Nephila pilipes]|uniref:GPS domain-containing protein n=1 Tax=Nephila pilipes TaxID=299642 RepID=A0A8X6QJS8_NEPPI|nr:GPS domain-containing protein [Nephila pilipes]